MQEHYKITFIIEHGDYEYWNGVLDSTLSTAPTLDYCIEATMEEFFGQHDGEEQDDELLDSDPVADAIAFYKEEGFVWLPGGERRITGIAYGLDYQAMVEQFMEQLAE